MVVHIFGDSHAEWGWSKIRQIKTHALHGSLCYSFGRDKLNRLNIRDTSYEVKNDDTVLFLFGEIDCSCHVHKYIKEEYTYKEVIEDIVKKYFEAIYENVRQFRSLCIFVCSLPPAVEKEKVYYEPDENGRLWLQHRFEGTNEERKQYVIYFNEKVKEFCKNYNYTFLNFHDDYRDVNGYLNRELSCPSVHIKDPIFIYKCLQDNNVSLD
jgi:hypothetical protein